jgi:pyruvate/2-oxoglutarate dehydrogenase complex dihydrolipoamide acyltransferase (E2) component
VSASIPSAELHLFCRDLRGTVGEAIVAATGRALLGHPGVGQAHRGAGTGVGVAVDTDQGLFVPVVRNAGDGPLPEVQAEVARLVAAARSGSLSATEVGGAAVTVCECTRDAGAVVAEASTGYVLAIDELGVDSVELTLFFTNDGPDIGREEERRFFAALVRLLRHPYRLLV